MTIINKELGPGAKPQKRPPAGDFTRTIPSRPADAKALAAEALLHFREAKSAGLARDVEEYFFRLALDEALTNAVKHGNRGDAAKEITLTVNVTKCGAKVTVCEACTERSRSEGGGFCVEKVPDPRSAERKWPCPDFVDTKLSGAAIPALLQLKLFRT